MKPLVPSHTNARTPGVYAYLGSNQHNAALEQKHAAIVAHAVVQHRHANVAQAAAAEIGGEQRGQRLPRVRDRVALVKVVFAAVAGGKAD